MSPTGRRGVPSSSKEEAAPPRRSVASSRRVRRGAAMRLPSRPARRLAPLRAASAEKEGASAESRQREGALGVPALADVLALLGHGLHRDATVGAALLQVEPGAVPDSDTPDAVFIAGGVDAGDLGVTPRRRFEEARALLLGGV